jgi:hypothetical protein
MAEGRHPYTRIQLKHFNFEEVSCWADRIRTDEGFAKGVRSVKVYANMANLEDDEIERMQMKSLWHPACKDREKGWEMFWNALMSLVNLKEYDLSHNSYES